MQMIKISKYKKNIPRFINKKSLPTFLTLPEEHVIFQLNFKAWLQNFNILIWNPGTMYIWLNNACSRYAQLISFLHLTQKRRQELHISTNHKLTRI